MLRRKYLPGKKKKGVLLRNTVKKVSYKIKGPMLDSLARLSRRFTSIPSEL